MPNGTWRESKLPSRSILGIGAVNPHSGHRFAEACQGAESIAQLDPYLTEVAPEIQAVVAFADRNGLGGVGDIANRFFPSLPLPRQFAISNSTEYSVAQKELNEMLRQLNSRMITIRWSHLHEIASNTSICGGTFKAQATFSVLLAGLINAEKRVVTELFTDVGRGKELLEALQSFHEANADTKDWYTTSASEDFFDD